MPHKFFRVGALLVGFAFGGLTMCAQDLGEAPKPAMAGDSASGVLQSDGATEIPDTRPLAGVQNLSLGTKATGHSFLLPSFGVTTQVQFNPYNSGPGNNSPISTTYLSGRLALNKISGHSELLLEYLTGGGFSNDSNQGGSSSLVQSLDFAETFRWGRWSQMFGDQFTYLPASSFGFAGLGGLNNFGVNLGTVGSTPGLRQDVVPNQSIVTNGEARIGNAVVAQTSYALGYRSSLSFYGSYGILNFLGNGLLNSSTISSGAGYNYLLSPLNSMSISYRFGRLILPGSQEGPDNHSVQLSFARRITARLSFQIGAGPDIQLYPAPLAGSGTVVSWALNSGLNYRLRNWATGFNYSHSLTGGSGVLPGAETDMFSGSLGRSFGNWQGALSVGYSRNQSLRQTITQSIAPQTWYAGVQASRRFVSYGSFFISYNASRQSSLAAVCSLPACQTNALTQTISLGYNWGFRPIVLE